MVVPLKVFSFQERLDDQNLNWGSKNGTWTRWIKCWMTRFKSLWNAYYYKNIDEIYLIGFYLVRIGLDQNYFQWRWKCFLLVRLLLSIALASSLGLLSSVSKPNKCASKSSEELYIYRSLLVSSSDCYLDLLLCSAMFPKMPICTRIAESTAEFEACHGCLEHLIICQFTSQPTMHPDPAQILRKGAMFQLLVL